jgi:mono/diheme cytochrome c family protein
MQRERPPVAASFIPGALMSPSTIRQLRRQGAPSRTAFALAVVFSGAAAGFARAAATDDQAKTAAGEQVYNTYCATCHGDDLVNTGQTFDLRKLKADERPRFENSVRNGKNQMPPWKGVLTDEEIDQVWHYIRANAYQK